MPLDALSTDSDSSYTWESLLDQSDLLTTEQKAAEKVNNDIGKPREREKEDYDFGVNDLDWDQRSVASAFSIYLAIEESARVSLLDCSLDGKSFDSESFDCGATKVTAETDFWSLSSDELDVTDITVRRTIECESSDESVVTEAYELDEEDTVESDYEVESFESEVLEATDHAIVYTEYGSESEESVATVLFKLEQEAEVERDNRVKS